MNLLLFVTALGAFVSAVWSLVLAVHHHDLTCAVAGVFLLVLCRLALAEMVCYCDRCTAEREEP